MAGELVQARVAHLVHTGVQRIRPQAPISCMGCSKRQAHRPDRNRRPGVQSLRSRRVVKAMPQNDSYDGRLAWRSADGRSALYHGDGLKLMKSIPSDSVDCIWTDPPYLLSNDGVTCIAGKRASVNKGKWDRSRGIDGDHEFNLSWLRECHRILKPSGTIWVTGCCACDTLAHLLSRPKTRRGSLGQSVARDT